MDATMPETADLQASGDVLRDMVRNYNPLARVHDELMTPDGRIRPHWRPLLTALSAFHTTELQHRFGFADRHLRDSGVVHRVYDTEGGAERPLPLSHIPLIVEPEEWTQIAAAASQRATLLNMVLGDIYGAQTLVAEGLLPPAAIAGSPDFLRPLVGTVPRGGDHLRFYAMDIGRGPDGRWWVLSDRTQAPSGAGYLLENRIALARALPELYRKLNVQRLAEFFRDFRRQLYGLSKTAGRRVGLLTPGTYNETYFEHAYLARYLGFLLVQGEDLVVHEGGLYVRTITGLQEIDVVLRRLDSTFADPLELDASSHIGVPSLVQAARNGTVAIINALGSGVVEAPVMMSYLPGICRHLLGDDLVLPHVATWWCGDEAVRTEMLPGLESRVVGPAFAAATSAPLGGGFEAVGDMDPERREALRAAITARGLDFVVQEAVQLSTTPIWDGRALAPRPFVLRVFATRKDDGWEVMPGGFCRISEKLDVRAVTLQRGARVADVWVPSEAPVEEVSLLTEKVQTESLRQGDMLPAITAENLFWLGRYIERAEGCTRLVRALAARLIDYDASEDGVIGELILDLEAQPRPKSEDPEDEGEAAPVQRIETPLRIDGAFVIAALTDREAVGSVASLTASARRAGSVIRERLSPDAWRILYDMAELANETPPHRAGEAEAVLHCNQLLTLMAASSGLAHNNMMRSAGWRFRQLGFRIERAHGTAQAVRHLGAVHRTPGAFEALLGVLDSQITFGTRYANTPLRSQVVDLVVIDQLNPRSLAFQAGRIEEHVQFLASIRGEATPIESEKIAIALSAMLRTIDNEEADDEFLGLVLQRLEGLANAIARDFFSPHRRNTTGWGLVQA
jgi:uncharacterized circularly permuted ATP-grasp superfamily protein/uncharacterized alpha-E superfamily protein